MIGSITGADSGGRRELSAVVDIDLAAAIECCPSGLSNSAGNTIKSPISAATNSVMVIQAKPAVGTKPLKANIAIPPPQIIVV